VTKLEWSLVITAKESGGRIAPAALRALVAEGDLDAQVAAFARRGYRFEPGPRGALVLSAWPRRLFAEEIAHGLGTDLVARRVETHWTVTSTNDLARAEARRGREGTAIFAEEQTGGRGRFGRKWVAPRFSALLFSVPFSCEAASVQAASLALAGAAAVAEAVAQVYSLPARIRWPNDVLIEGRKIAGVLVEQTGARARRWLVAGIGVNVNLDPAALPRGLEETAGTIRQFLGHDADRALLARAILRRLDFWWEVLKARDVARLSGVCLTLSSIIGTFVTLESRGKRHTGRVVDIDAEVGLVLQMSGGPTRVFAPAETTLVH